MNFFPFHIGDYAAHTRHLTLMEDLAYRRLLDWYYTHERHIPAVTQSVCRLIGMPEHAAAVDSVLLQFFTKDADGKWMQKRCDQEIARFREAQKSGRLAWLSRLPREHKAALASARRARLQHAFPKWLTSKERIDISRFYAEANRLTSETGIPHQVDHEVPLNGETVCGLHVPWNLKVITAAANRAKGNHWTS